MARPSGTSGPFALAVTLLAACAFLGALGLASVYAVGVGSVAGVLSSLFDGSVSVDSATLTIAGSAFGSPREPMLIPAYSLYYAIPVVVAVVGATPALPLPRRLLLTSLAVGGTWIGQAVLVTGFARMDLSGTLQSNYALVSYAAWWSMGPVLFAAWWYWTRWMPPVKLRARAERRRRAQ